jgi:hypothetical protein
MTLLVFIGFIAICLGALYFTFASIVWFFGASLFGDGLTGPLVMAVIAGGLWTLAYNLSPFTISVNLT